MGSDFKLSGASDERGVLPRVVDAVGSSDALTACGTGKRRLSGCAGAGAEQILQRVRAASEDKKIVVRVSFLEVRIHGGCTRPLMASN